MRKKVLFNLRRPPEGLIKIHENKDLVRVEIRRQFYRQLEEAAKRLETTPDKLIYNAIRLILMKNVDKEKHKVLKRRGYLTVRISFVENYCLKQFG